MPLEYQVAVTSLVFLCIGFFTGKAHERAKRGSK